MAFGIMCGDETNSHRYAQCKPLVDLASEVLMPFAWRRWISQLKGDINEKTGQAVDVQGKGGGVPQPVGNRTA